MKEVILMSGKYTFKMPIGDWSNDGHGNCEYYNVTSDLPLKEVREAHFKIGEVTGIDISKICSKHNDDVVEYDVMKRLLELGFDGKKLSEDLEGLVSPEGMIVEMNEDDYNDNSPFTPDDIANIWVFLLNEANEDLNLELIDDVESIVFYGFDEKGRHIESPGYGVFYS